MSEDCGVPRQVHNARMLAKDALAEARAYEELEDAFRDISDQYRGRGEEELADSIDSYIDNLRAEEDVDRGMEWVSPPVFDAFNRVEGYLESADDPEEAYEEVLNGELEEEVGDFSKMIQNTGKYRQIANDFRDLTEELRRFGVSVIPRAGMGGILGEEGSEGEAAPEPGETGPEEPYEGEPETGPRDEGGPERRPTVSGDADIDVSVYVEDLEEDAGVGEHGEPVSPEYSVGLQGSEEELNQALVEGEGLGVYLADDTGGLEGFHVPQEIEQALEGAEVAENPVEAFISDLGGHQGYSASLQPVMQTSKKRTGLRITDEGAVEPETSEEGQFAYELNISLPSSFRVDEEGDYSITAAFLKDTGSGISDQRVYDEAVSRPETFSVPEAGEPEYQVEMSVLPRERSRQGDSESVPGLKQMFKSQVLGEDKEAEYAVQLEGEDEEELFKYLEDTDAIEVRAAPGVEENDGDVMVSRSDFRSTQTFEVPDIDHLDDTEQVKDYLEDFDNISVHGNEVRFEETYDIGKEREGLFGGISNAFSDAGMPSVYFEAESVAPETKTAEGYFEEVDGEHLLNFLDEDVRSFLGKLDTQPLLSGRSPGYYTTEEHDKGVYGRFRGAQKSSEGVVHKVSSSDSWRRAITAGLGIEGLKKVA